MSDKIVRIMNPSGGARGDQGVTRGGNKPSNDVKSRVNSRRGARSRGKGRGESEESVEVDGTGKTGGRNTKRGRSMNDLLNFQFHHPTPRSYQHHGSRKAVSHYTKEQFVQVSCQFVLRSGEWQGLCVPDSVVDWEHVVQVILPCDELPSCPICLFPPSCPLTPICGHSMCFSCSLQYVDNCPEGGCPICHVNISMDAMRPLLTRYKPEPKIGQAITFKLVNRLRNSTVVCPSDISVNMLCAPNIESQWGSKFCNIVTATPQQILQSVYLAQENDLKTQLLLVDEMNLESEPYIIQALTDLEAKKEACFTEMEGGVVDCEEKVADDGSQKKVFFFQSSDGQPVFIHPVNAKCLISEFGSIENSPSEIISEIIDIEYFTMTPELRSKHRYISHLPLGSTFALCEINISPFVSPETLDKCGKDIEMRAKRRSKKESREKAYDEQFKQQEVTYHCSAYLPEYTEISKPSSDHFKSQESYTDLTQKASNQPLSFAEKLRKGASSDSPWVNNTTPAPRTRMDSEVSEGGGAESQAPSYQSSFSASLNDAFANFDLHQEEAPPVNNGLGGRGKKKKKGKTILLTTGGARRQ